MRAPRRTPNARAPTSVTPGAYRGDRGDKELPGAQRIAPLPFPQRFWYNFSNGSPSNTNTVFTVRGAVRFSHSRPYTLYAERADVLNVLRHSLCPTRLATNYCQLKTA